MWKYDDIQAHYILKDLLFVSETSIKAKKNTEKFMYMIVFFIIQIRIKTEMFVGRAVFITLTYNMPIEAFKHGL